MGWFYRTTYLSAEVNNNKLQISYSLAAIGDAVHQFWQYAHDFRIITFEGGLGSGKTTFCSALAQHIGIETPLNSPTFALMNEYLLPMSSVLSTNSPTPSLLMHMDWYRIADEEEALQAGVEHILNQPEYRCWIEWPGVAARLLPKPYLHVKLELGDAMDERKLIAEVQE